MVALADTWEELVTAGLLGTERRDPPELPAGLLADTVADVQRTTPQGRLLAAVAATVVAQRCGATPLPPRPLLLPPEPDHRPLLPTSAVERWQMIVSNWPVLEAEWLGRAASGGWRPAPDVLVALLRRHRRTPVLARAVLAWGGPAAAWLVDHIPDLEPVAAPVAQPTGDVRPLPVPAELEPLLGAAADTLAEGLVDGLASGKFRWSHRAVLLNVVARMDAESLPTVIAALGRRRAALAEVADDVAPLAVWEAVLELATTRARDARRAAAANWGNAMTVLRPHAEMAYADELAALAADDRRHRPPHWNLSPWAVVTYLLGGRLDDGTEITPKYIGQRRLVEIAVATLATDRALLLLGVPGTAKTWVSEHLATAISGDSTLLVQGTAGTTEETLRYGWNYALLLSRGPTEEALVPSPVYRGMSAGQLVRVEEMTRMPSEVQDALVTILSEKVLPIPELGTELAAVGGFNLIATANVRDRGVNEMSSALRRRFNTVVLPLPATAAEEMTIVSRRVAELGSALDLPEVPTASEEIERVVTIFRELREGRTVDGRTSLKVPSGTLSTAEAISVITNGLALATHFGDGELAASDVAAGVVGAVVRDPVHDEIAWREYLEGVVRDRDGWSDFYAACREIG